MVIASLSIIRQGDSIHIEILHYILLSLMCIYLLETSEQKVIIELQGNTAYGYNRQITIIIVTIQDVSN